MSCSWSKAPIKNILLDINGVLFESGEHHPIEGSVDALKRLIAHGFGFCLVTNECTTAKRLLSKKLNEFGYDEIQPDKIVSPAPVACRYLVEKNLTPRFHVDLDQSIREDFLPIIELMKADEPPNCLVVGDAMDKISRDFLDESLELMLNSPVRPTIIGLGAGRYYKDAGRLRMDTGAYVKAFEYCLGVEALSFGKPSEAFFHEALDIVKGTPSDTIMIGDDILSDVGGAQKLGMRGFLVRTGKYKPSDETQRGVTADHVFDNLSAAVDALISSSQHHHQ